ncbi:lysophospholipid acyltransferase family protein [Belliella kenyensis]|uniref:Lysophospholipid acyltransferase family protein n=1 Tax=Belliella kenyensis TaxID=1472724 RepID=A0ABV8EHR6_9BACT|nr:lysophospholipid acyltransferase family protein [Belliella kenyensis]MCH7402752.1 lysophospholipid acyltransferase family protein [Belliella kenyensis]MDN3603700.1 lysophospholipid acyltransferase family protein [Belliella kenyensis]
MIVIKLISYLPLNILYFFSDLLYLIGYYLVGYRKEIIRENLKHAFPEKSKKERLAIERKFFRNLTDSFAEIIKMYTISKSALDKRVKIQNAHIPLDLIAKGEVVIGMTGHFFNWEMHLLQMMANISTQCEVVYLKVNNPFFEKLMKTIRGRFGGLLVERSEFQREYLRNRNKPRMIVLAADQRPTRAEVRYWAPFMNRETIFFEGAEKLAKRFNHSVIYSDVQKPKRGHYIFTYSLICEPPYQDSREHSITDAFISRTEKTIKENPSLYLWSHNRWKISK